MPGPEHHSSGVAQVKGRETGWGRKQGGNEKKRELLLRPDKLSHNFSLPKFTGKLRTAPPVMKDAYITVKKFKKREVKYGTGHR